LKGLNETCASESEINDVLDFSEVFFIMQTRYFDMSEFEANPIKK
jgi:hypothetical protein